MSAGGITYDWTIEGKTPGVAEAISKVDAGTASMGKLEAATKKYVSALMSSGVPLDRIDRLGKLLNGAGKEAPKLTEGFKGVGSAIEHTQSRMATFLEFTGAILAVEAVKKITEGIIDLGAEILHASGEAERMDMSLKLTVGEEGAKNVLEWIDKISSKTRFTDDQLKGWAGQLLRSGVAMKDVDKYIAAGLDLNAKGGDMGTAIEALNRAQITGKIGTRQLVGLGISTAQIGTLDGYQGLSKDALNKKIEAGSITTDQLFKLIAGKDGVIGDLGLKGGEDFETKLKNLKTLPEQYFQKFAESPAFETLKGKMGEIFDSLDPNSERGAKIFGSIERSFTKFVDLIARIDFEKVASTIETKVVPAMETLAGLIKPMVDGILRIVDGASMFAHAVGVVTKPGRDAASGFAGGLSPALDFAGGAFDFIKNHVGLGKDAGQAVTDGMKAGMSGMDDVMQSSAVQSIDATKDAWGIHSPSKVAEEMGRNISAGMRSGLGDDVAAGAFAVPAPNGGRSVGAGWGAPQITIEVNVDGHGKSGSELGQLIAAEIASVVPSMLLGAFEQANTESGAV